MQFLYLHALSAQGKLAWFTMPGTVILVDVVRRGCIAKTLVSACKFVADPRLGTWQGICEEALVASNGKSGREVEVLPYLFGQILILELCLRWCLVEFKPLRHRVIVMHIFTSCEYKWFTECLFTVLSMNIIWSLKYYTTY